MTLDDIEDVFTYLNAHPTASEILQLVYEVKPKGPISKFELTEEEFMQEVSGAEMRAINEAAFGEVLKPSDDFVDNMKFAEEMMRQMKKKPVN